MSCPQRAGGSLKPEFCLGLSIPAQGITELDSERKASLLARLTSAGSSDPQPEVLSNDAGEGEIPRPSPKPSTKTNMVAREVGVSATGLHPGKTDSALELFTEETNSILVHESGGVIQLSATVARGQLLLLANLGSKREVVAQVKRTYRPMNRCVELEFAEPAPRFWGTEFSAATAMLPKDAKHAEAAQLLAAGASADEPEEPPLAPTAEEVLALKREIQALREKVPSPAAVRESLPVEHHPIPMELTPEEQAQLPKPALDFALPPKRLLGARGRFTPGAALRLTALAAALVATAVGTAWYKHSVSLRSSLKKPSGVPTVGADVSTSLTTATQRPGTKRPESANTNVASDAPTASLLTPSQAGNSGDHPLASSASVAQPVGGKTSPSSPLTGGRATVSPTTRPTPNPIPASPAETRTVPPKLIKSVKAVASLEALRDFETGHVVIDAVVGAEGEVHFITVISGPPSLRDPAVRAVKQYRYEPAMRNGQPVPEHVTITVRFRFES